MKILLFTAFYIPGFKGGGPIRTISNMAQAVGGEFNFSIVTLDRDLGDLKPYNNIIPTAWQRKALSRIYYVSPEKRSFNIPQILRKFDGDCVHLNSFFSFSFSIFPLMVVRWLRPRLIVVIGPRGEFSSGALGIKSFKKFLYIKFSKLIGLYKDVIWHASTQSEVDDIRRVIGVNVEIKVAIDIAIPPVNFKPKPKADGAPLHIIFLSRISPKKNLLGALDILKKVQCEVVFHVFGPIEDNHYWGQCLSASKKLPKHISFEYKGTLKPDEVPLKFADYDLFLFPTLGENFGHVIAEALFSGLPVLISDNTPWRQLEINELGWDLSISNPDLFVRHIETCHGKSTAEYNQWRHKIRTWALRNIDNKESINQNRRLFLNVMKLRNE